MRLMAAMPSVLTADSAATRAANLIERCRFSASRTARKSASVSGEPGWTVGVVMAALYQINC